MGQGKSVTNTSQAIKIFAGYGFVWVGIELGGRTGSAFPVYTAPRTGIPCGLCPGGYRVESAAGSPGRRPQ